jgi:hypothetical protein
MLGGRALMAIKCWRAAHRWARFRNNGTLSDPPEPARRAPEQTDACASPECACRDVVVQAWHTGDELIDIVANGLTVKLLSKPGAPKREGQVLTVAVNIDTEAGGSGLKYKKCCFPS